jgi:hypothetical protein
MTTCQFVCTLSQFVFTLSQVNVSCTQARDFCKTKVWDLPDGVLNMYKFSLAMHDGHAVLFGGMYVANPQSKGNCSNSIIRVNLSNLTYEHIKTQGMSLFNRSDCKVSLLQQLDLIAYTTLCCVP